MSFWEPFLETTSFGDDETAKTSFGDDETASFGDDFPLSLGMMFSKVPIIVLA
jgi:hypothetical protein